MYCVLVSLRLHNGLRAIHSWGKDKTYTEESHVVKTIKDASRASRVFGPVLLLLDRLYLTVPMLKALRMEKNIEVVTKAKMNCKAYYHPEPKTGRGAKPKKGKDVKVATLFETMADAFTTAKVTLYGEEKTVRYYSVDLLWGDKLYQELRFVLVWVDDVKTILVSTGLAMSPKVIIEAYCHRFKIECAFRELKQVIAGLSYHFWSKHMPKLDRFMNNDDRQDQLAGINKPEAQRCIVKTIDAINLFAFTSCMALGLLQIASIQFKDVFTGKGVRFLRTPSRDVPSEATVADFMRKTIYQLFRFFPDLPITAIIKKHQALPDDEPFVPSA